MSKPDVTAAVYQQACKENCRHELHKFGGSSLADGSCYLRVAAIMARYGQAEDVIVVSAAGNTTNQLISWYQLNQTDKLAALSVLHELRRYQTTLISELLSGELATELTRVLLQDIEHLVRLLDGPLTDATYAEVVGHGEIWSARLLAEVLKQHDLAAVWIDAREFLYAERAVQPQVDEGISYQHLQPILARYPHQRIVITGFICRNQQGETVLLGRNGSDYSATQIGALIGVNQVTIWSDVAGVYSADPRKIKDACLLPLLRLDEASELARLSAPVLHARTLQPVMGSNIELQLRCSYQPEDGSTRIERVLASGTGAKIVTSHDGICLIEYYLSPRQEFATGQQMLEELLYQRQVKPLAIGLHPDRHLIQLCYTPEVAASALKLLTLTDLPGELQLRENLALVAIVGAGVGKTPLHSHRFFQQIKDLPLEFISQAEDGISLAAVLRMSSTEHIIQRLHNSLFCAEKRVGLVLFGKGNIGSRWLELFGREQTVLSARTGFEFVLAGVVGRDKCWLNYEGLDANRVLAFFDKEATAYQSEQLMAWMRKHPFDDLVILDITASSQVTNQYLDFATYGFHVISANKLAGSSDSMTYQQLRNAFTKTGRYWLYNATVGAGLPVNYAVRDLCDSGDEILSISGIFSGTLSWLFQQFDGSCTFSELIDQAWQQGLTEPDPREDLSGLDVMRKLVILAREAGYAIEPDQVRVESLVPAELAALSVDDFFDRASMLNEQMLQRLEAAKEMDLVLRYVARFESKGVMRIGVEAVPQDHPLAVLLPCDNVFVLSSRWYRDNPLVIRGPGAGRDVTAGAIQSDLNRLASLL